MAHDLSKMMVNTEPAWHGVYNPTRPMLIKIRNNAAAIYMARINFGPLAVPYPGWYEKLSAIQGQLIEVETNCLFLDQFNTGPISGVSETGLRIMAESVEYVLNDARRGQMKCHWCGKTSPTADVCGNPRCGDPEPGKHLKKFEDKFLDYWKKPEGETK